MKIISGKTGTPHVTSAQFRQIIEGIIGQESYILKSGENMEPELASNNMLKIRGGVMSHHGNVSGVDLNTYDEVTIRNGSQGMKRIDLIVNRYTRSDETGIEKNEWVVLTGTPDQSSPKVPGHIVGNLQNGDLTDDCPVFKVHLEGIQVTKVEKLLPVLEGDLASLNSKLEQSAPGKFTLPNGLKIFWGEAVTSGSKDPANMYSVQVNFPESFSSDSYFFAACIKLMQSTDPTKWDTAVNYYERTKSRAWIGSSAHARTTFSWLAIGY